MALPGRKPKPTHLKVVEGNPGRRPLNAAEPKVPPARPEPPEHLGEIARAEWERVMPMMFRAGIVTALDRGTLAAYCMAYQRWVTAEDALAEMAKNSRTGALVIETKSKNVIQNPLVGTANSAMRDMVKYAAELGITPSARSRITAAGEGPDDDPAAEFYPGR